MDLSKILEKIKPTKKEEEKVNKIVKRFLEKLNKKLVKANAVVGGSFAKDTWLKQDHDIDIFVIFDPVYKSEEISSMLKYILKKTFRRVKTIHGSRDYYQIKKGKYTFEIVPVLKISNPKEAKIITDISPLHIKWVKENLDELEDEIRLSKAFCKAQEVYGAESYIKGFSGYVLEILTIYYGSFKALLKEALKWKPKQVIDIESYGTAKTLNIAKVQSPLILIDPVQSDRNAAAALSKEKFYKFISAAKLYLENPSEEFFIQKHPKIKELKRKKYLILKIKPLKGKKDIIGSKILKVFEYIKLKLEKEGFIILEDRWYWNKKAVLWYKIKNKILPATKKHYGPPISKKKNLQEFMERWKDYKFHREKNRVYVNLKREHRTLKDYTKYLIKDPEIKKNVKRIKVVSAK
jgi:tRNA nucleotidyltransferase (CCA-adding enzyme)